MTQPATDQVENDIEHALKALVSQNAVKVPPYPAVALKLSQLVRQENYGVAEIVRIVAADATLTADLLRCANSSVYSRGVEVTSLQQAVSRIGAQEVTRLAVASALAQATQSTGPLQAMKRSAWQCSVASAVICQEIAMLRGLGGEDAFLCGLLHDYGRLIALSGLEEILAEMPEVVARPLASWIALVDRVHVKLGMLLATKWKLPKVYQDAIALHHEPPPSRVGANIALVDVVTLSDGIVQMMLERPSVDDEALKGFALSDRERARIAEVMPGIPGVIASFEGEVRGKTQPSKVVVPELVLPEGFRKVELQVHQLKPKKRGPYTLRGIAAGAWVMMGKEAINENSLIEVTIEAPPKPMTLWAHVTRCAPEGDGARIECKAFALSGTNSTQMFELFRNAK